MAADENNSISLPKSQSKEAQILAFRRSGRMADAIRLCETEAHNDPDSLFFPKIACDLYLSIGRTDKAADWVLEMLLRMWTASSQLFNEFAARFQKISFRLPAEEQKIFHDRLRGMIQEGLVSQRFVARSNALLRDSESNRKSQASLPGSQSQQSVPLSLLTRAKENIPAIETTDQSDANSFLKGIISSGISAGKLIILARRMEASAPHQLESAIATIPISALYSTHYRQLFDFLIAFLERRERFLDALRLLQNHPGLQVSSLIQASFLRVCRKLSQFELVQNFLSENPSAAKTDKFNVLYELVYFYEAQNDLQKVRYVLDRIKTLFPSQQPILATLRNFYLRFGLFSDASEVDTQLGESPEKNRRLGWRKRARPDYSEAFTESTAEFYSDLEHQRQLAALSDVTNGISHELGQPITNIRYTIQLFQRQLEREMKSEVVFAVFETVLRETERMGGLVKRLAPITSARKVIEDFDAVGRVKERIASERARIVEHNVDVAVEADGPINMRTDPVRFDQLVSNLLLNALDAVSEFSHGGQGRLRIALSKDRAYHLKLVFTDNGAGISPEHRRKIFEPFFSTKAPGKGEGLGLFIVWNLLKMQGGSISMDSTYQDGARFVILLPLETKLPQKPIEP